MISLSDWVKTHGKSGTARQLGVTPGAVHQMLLKNRDIRVEIVDNVAYFREYKNLAECKMD